MSPIRVAAVLALLVFNACSEDSPSPAPEPSEPPVSSARPFRPCGAIGAGALAASALSPDGSVLAAATLSGQLVLYRRADGSRLNTLWDLPGQQVGVAFSRDGRLLVAASRTETRVWSFPELTPVRTFTRPHADRTTALALSPDGALIATGGFDAATSDTAIVRIWSVADGSLQGVWQRQFEQVVQSLAFSPDGASLAIATHHFVETVHAPDASGRKVIPALSGGQLSWSAEGSLLASGGVVARVDTGARVKPPATSLIPEANAFSPDGLLYAEAVDAGVTVYRVADWTKLHTLPGLEASRVSRLAFSADGADLVVDLGVSAFACNGSGQLCRPWGNEVRIHSLQDPSVVRTVSLGPEMSARVAFSPDGSLLAGNADGVLGLWRTSDLSAVAAPAVEQPWRLQFSPDLSRLLVDNAIYDLATGQRVQTFSDQALSPDFTLSARHEGLQVLLSDVATGTPRKTFDVDAEVLGFSPDGRFIVALEYTGRNVTRLLDVAGGRVSNTFEREFNKGGSAVAFSPDGRWLSSAGLSSVEVFGRQGGAGASLQAGFAAAFSPDSTVLATGSTEAEVLLWKTSDFSVRERLSGHGTFIAQAQWPRSITWVAFSRTGQLATLGEDRTVRLWCSP